MVKVLSHHNLTIKYINESTSTNARINEKRNKSIDKKTIQQLEKLLKGIIDEENGQVLFCFKIVSQQHGIFQIISYKGQQ